jgi:hypothetical protein
MLMLNRLTGFNAAQPLNDPHFANVVSLLHFDGANGSTTFTDEKGKIWTPNGNAQISTAQSRFGGASGLFDGTGDYLTTPATSDFEPGSGDYTLEGFVRMAATPATAAGIIQRANASGFANFSVSWRSSNKIEAYCSLSNPASTPTILTGATTLSLNTWYHWAFVKSGLNYKLFIGGVQDASGSAASHPPTGLSTVTYIGSFDAASFFLNGYQDEKRITKGVARYTANFTPPSSPFPNN